MKIRFEACDLPILVIVHQDMEILIQGAPNEVGLVDFEPKSDSELVISLYHTREFPITDAEVIPYSETTPNEVLRAPSPAIASSADEPQNLDARLLAILRSVDPVSKSVAPCGRGRPKQKCHAVRGDVVIEADSHTELAEKLMMSRPSVTQAANKGYKPFGWQITNGRMVELVI